MESEISISKIEKSTEDICLIIKYCQTILSVNDAISRKLSFTSDDIVDGFIKFYYPLSREGVMPDILNAWNRLGLEVDYITYSKLMNIYKGLISQTIGIINSNQRKRNNC